MPGFDQAIWIDEERNGWITVAFEGSAQQRQAELEAALPDVGAVVVESPVPLKALRELQSDISHIPGTSNIDVARGRVALTVGLLDSEMLELLAPFADAPLCASGLNPATSRIGAQPDEGPGWRLLHIGGTARHRNPQTAKAGTTILGVRVELATSPTQYATSWDAFEAAADTGLTNATPLPDVDFANEVVVFGNTVESGSCALIVWGTSTITENDRTTLVIDAAYADDVSARGCTDDANPVSWVVAIDRSRLPTPPFIIRGPVHVGASDLFITTDLRPPNSLVGNENTIATQYRWPQPIPEQPIPPGYTSDPRPTTEPVR